MTQIERARSIGRTLGTYKAARYLAKRGWSIEAAMWVLVESKPPKKGQKNGR